MSDQFYEVMIRPHACGGEEFEAITIDEAWADEDDLIQAITEGVAPGSLVNVRDLCGAQNILGRIHGEPNRVFAVMGPSAGREIYYVGISCMPDRDA
jgi:hypothetical protein